MKKDGKKIAYIPYDGKELNNLCFSPKYKTRWSNLLKKKLEKNGDKINTYDIQSIEDSDEILSFDNIYHQNTKHFWKMFFHKKLDHCVHIDYEPPVANCRIHDKKGLKKLSKLFKYLITYNDEVVDGKKIIKGCIGDSYEEPLSYKKDFNKRKLIAVVANYRVNLMLFGQHKDELYSKRGEAVKYFQDKCPDDFDLYGSYWPEEYKKVYRYPVDRDKKSSVISQYKFLLSYDSMKNQRGYISEKIFDCFKAKTVPIYWGADNVIDYIPKDCFIDKRDFKTYDELYTYLINMTEEEYNKRIQAIEEYLESDKYKNLFSSEASANIIYNALMSKGKKVNYFIAFFILLEFQIKRMTNPKYNYDNYYFDDRVPKELLIDTFYQINDKLHIIFCSRIKKEYNAEFIAENNGKPIELLNYKKIPQENVNSYNYTFDVDINDIRDNIKFFLVINKEKIPLKVTVKPGYRKYCRLIKLKYNKSIRLINFHICSKSSCTRAEILMLLLRYDPMKAIKMSIKKIMRVVKRIFGKFYRIFKVLLRKSNSALIRILRYTKKKFEKHPFLKKLFFPLYVIMRRTIVFFNRNFYSKSEKLSFYPIKKISYVPYVGTEQKSEIFRVKYKNNWTYKLKKITREKNIELETCDVLNINKADAVIFFDNMYYKNLSKMWDLYYGRKLHRTVYIDYEPPTGHCRNHSDRGIKRLSNIFKNVITYNDDLVNGKSIIKGCIGDNWGNDLDYKNDFEKRKLIAMITNNTKIKEIIGVLNYCNSSVYYNTKNIKPHRKQIYSRREEVARYFLNKCPNDFDLYGVHWSDEYKAVIKKYIPRGEKTKTISQYKFLLSYDSIRNQRGYISEKIFDCFKAKTVPIYWGADNVTDYIPKECFIDKRDFKTYDELYTYLINMTEEEYNKRIKAIEEYLESDQYKNLFSSEASANIIYNALMLKRPGFSYKKAYKMLLKLQKKRDKVDKYKSTLVFSSIDPADYYKIHIKAFYIEFENNNIEFVVQHNDKFISNVKYKKTGANNNEIYEHSFDAVLENVKYGDKICIYIRKGSKLIKLRITESIKDYHKNLGLRITKNKKCIIRSV